MCHCSNPGMEWTPDKSQHTKLSLEKKILICFCQDSNSQLFDHKSGAFPTSCPWIEHFLHCLFFDWLNYVVTWCASNRFLKISDCHAICCNPIAWCYSECRKNISWTPHSIQVSYYSFWFSMVALAILFITVACYVCCVDSVDQLTKLKCIQIMIKWQKQPIIVGGTALVHFVGWLLLISL